ncbi:MAG: hypothetical protein IKH15_11965 [Bacteroidales bacterium]|nr:hypothetical protein [Bacteroidales bacterium]
MIALNGSVNLANRSAIVFRGTLRGIGAAISANWVGILLTVAMALAQAWANATKLRRELKEIEDGLSNEISKQVSRYNELLDVATDVTKKEQDRSRALDALKAEYGNILDIQNVELANVEQLNKARSEQIELIKIQAFEEAKQKAVIKAVEATQNQERAQMKGLYAEGGVDEFIKRFKSEVPGLIDVTKQETEQAMRDVNELILKGTIKTTEEARNEFLRLLLTRSGADENTIGGILSQLLEPNGKNAFYKSFEQIASSFKKVFSTAAEINGFGDGLGIDMNSSRILDDYRQRIKEMAKVREDFERELTEEDKIFYKNNPAQKKLNLQFLIERYADNMREAVKNQDFGEIGVEMQKKLLNEIEKAFNQNSLGNNVELWVLEAASQVNKEFPNLQTPFGDAGNMGLAKGESLEKLIKRIDDRVKELDADLYKVKYGKGGDVLDVTNRWGEQAMVRIMEEQEALGRFRELIATSQAMTAKEIEQRRKDIESLASDVIALADGWWALSEAEQQFNQENIGERAFDLKIDPPTDYNIESIAKWVDDQVQKIVGPKARTSLKIKIDKETIKETKDASKTLSGIFDDLVDYYKKTVSDKLPKEVGDALLEVVQDRVAEFNKNPNKAVEVQLPLAFNLDSLYDWLEENKDSFTNEDFSSALLKLFETKKSDQDSNRNKANQYKSDLKAFLTDLKNARKEMDKLNDAEDKLFVEKLQHQGKKVGVSIADNFEPTKEVLDDIINTYLPKLDKADQIDLRLTWSKEDTSDAIKNMSDEVSRLWDQYDNSKKMEDWGFVPQEGSSKETMERIMSYERELRAQNTEEATKAAEDIKKRRLEIARSEQEEAAKIMYEANKKALDNVQQAYQTMQEKIAGIQKSTQPESEKEKAIANQVAKSLRDAADAQWDAYKGSEMYVQSFGDLENMSKSALLGIKAGLIEWSDYAKGALQTTELKAIEKQIKKIDELLGVERTKTHFGAIVKAFQEVTEAGEKMRELPELSREMADAQFEYIEAQESRAIYESINAQEKSEESARDLADAIEREATAKKNAEDATAAYTAAQNTASTKLNNAKKRVAQVKENFSAFSDAIENTVDFFTDLYEAMGFVVSDETAAAIDGMKQGFALIGSAITMAESAMNAYTIATEIADAAGKSLISTFWPLLAVMVAIGAAVAILKARDAALEKQVEQHKENVEKLEKAYEKLEKAIDKALDLTDARQSYAEMNANLAKQRKELEEAIAANNSRKQTDKVKEETENLQDTLDALDDKVEETRDKWLDMLGAPTDYQGLARDWSEGWLSAFKETGSGLESLHESFDELYDDLVVGQLWSKIMGPQIENLQQMVKDALADGDLTSTEAAAIRAFKNTLAYTSAELEQKAKELGIAGGTLTGDTLQRGVESMTEKTAEALESILNATRYDVSNTNVQVANIANVLSGEGENTIMAHLRSQTRYLSDIARIASAIYYPGGHPKGAGAIKVITEMA